MASSVRVPEPPAIAMMASQELTRINSRPPPRSMPVTITTSVLPSLSQMSLPLPYVTPMVNPAWRFAPRAAAVDSESQSFSERKLEGGRAVHDKRAGALPDAWCAPAPYTVIPPRNAISSPMASASPFVSVLYPKSLAELRNYGVQPSQRAILASNSLLTPLLQSSTCDLASQHRPLPFDN